MKSKAILACCEQDENAALKAYERTLDKTFIAEFQLLKQTRNKNTGTV